MAPPKKNVKMDLSSFLADDSFGGSWADEEVDINSIGVSLDQPSYSTAAPIGNSNTNTGSATTTNTYGSGSTSGFDSHNTSGNDEFRRERKEFPIPDQPPYRARISNLPWETDESGIVRHFEDRMQAQDIISDIVLPKDRDTGKLRGFAFVTFNEREILEESLNLTMTEFQGRKIYVNVAAPPKESEGEWRRGGSNNNSSFSSRREPAPEFDWGSARNARAELPPRQRSNRNFENNDENNTNNTNNSTTSPRPPRRQEPELDWGSARGARAELPPRQRSNRNFDNNNDENNTTPRTPRRQEPDFDWGSARTTRAELPIRERSKRNSIDNNSTSTTTTNATTTIRKPSEPEFDWKRGQSLPAGRRSNSNSNINKKDNDKKEDQSDKQQGPQKSHFSVLNIEDEEDEEDQDGSNKKEEKVSQVGELIEKTADLSVTEDNDGWEVVKK